VAIVVLELRCLAMQRSAEAENSEMLSGWSLVSGEFYE
jgi:hypothetical protein